jgi:hemolysin activation/secretion protein
MPACLRHTTQTENRVWLPLPAGGERVGVRGVGAPPPHPHPGPLPACGRGGKARRAGSIGAWALGCLAAAPGLAQVDAGSLLRETQSQRLQAPLLPDPPPARLLQDSGAKVRVSLFEISGSTRFGNSALAAPLQGLIGQELGFAGLQDAADRVAAVYREAGLHATAVLPEQTLQGGVVRIVVVEGRLGGVRLEVAPGSRELPRGLVLALVQRGQQTGELIDTRALERGTLLANEVPGVRASSVLVAGEAAGSTDIVVRADSRPLLAASASLDNHDARATGAVRAGATLRLGGPFGVGESVQALLQATEGKRFGRLAADAPLGDSGARLQLSASSLHYELVGEFAASGAEGSAQTLGLALTWPLVRSAPLNVVLAAAADRRRFVNDSVAGNVSDKLVDALTFTVSGDRTDRLGGGGALVGSLALTQGTLDLSRNPADAAADAASGANRAGGYSKLAWQIGRLQRLSARQALWLTGSGQFSRGNLDSGEKFSLGGAQGVRAFPAQEASGDRGWLVSAEWRWRLNDAVQLSPFIDHGEVKRDAKPFANDALPQRVALGGVGVSLEWQIGPVLLRGAVAERTRSNPLARADGRDSDGTKRRPQAWLGLSASL